MENKYPKISFVSPVFKADKILPKLIFEIEKVMLKIGEDYEIILIDDRSLDNSWEVMRGLSSNHKKIKSIRLSKNFGQHPAIIAGLFGIIGSGSEFVTGTSIIADSPLQFVAFLTFIAGVGVGPLLAWNKKE